MESRLEISTGGQQCRRPLLYQLVPARGRFVHSFERTPTGSLQSEPSSTRLSALNISPETFPQFNCGPVSLDNGFQRVIPKQPSRITIPPSSSLVLLVLLLLHLLHLLLILPPETSQQFRMKFGGALGIMKNSISATTRTTQPKNNSSSSE